MNPSQQSHLTVVAKTHPGMQGKTNEDRYGVSAYTTNAHPPIPVVLAVIADGIGGHRAGEVAAEMAVEAISESVAKSDGSDPVEILRRSITSASALILERSQSQPDLVGMGSTCACCLVVADRLYTANLGDSRIYMTRGEQIYQLSTDHTWIQEALDAGLLTPEQAIGHPNTHIIHRHLGSAEPPMVDFRLRYPGRLEDAAHPESSQGLPLQPNDQILLCSDGLTDLVHADEIYTALTSNSGSEALDNLIELANSRGGHDNITIVLLQVPTPASPPPTAEPRQRSRAFGCILAGLALIILAIVILASSWYWKNLGVTSKPTATEVSGQVLPALTTQLPTTSLPTATAAAQDSSTLPASTASPAATPEDAQATFTPWPTNTVIP